MSFLVRFHSRLVRPPSAASPEMLCFERVTLSMTQQ
jgi:hypothetical protein